jgi:predicted Zn-dependent protease
MVGSEADAVKVEHDVGQDLAREIRHQLGLDQEPQIRQILNEVGPRLAACVANKSRTFRFEAVRSTEPNAFALPGGFIFMTRSLLELCQWNQDEVAFILGHEMGHVIRGHAMSRIVSNSAIAAASRAAPVRSLLAGWLHRVGVQFLESAYSRDLESEADNLGVRLTAAAGYNPRAAVQLLRRLSKLKSPANQFDLGSYFSSHPAFDVRIQNINSLLRKLQLT